MTRILNFQIVVWLKALTSDTHKLWVSKWLVIVSAACFAALLPSSASAQTFTLQSNPDAFTAVYGDGTGRTITVTMEPRNTSCASINGAGVATLFARSSIAACDQTIEMRFTTSGFAIESIIYRDIDDMDGTAPRDSFAANVPGTWTSPTIEIHSFAAPPAYADQAGRLTAAGAVGTFLANDAGNNPINETATFALAMPGPDFSILFDDVQGVRGARVQFALDFIELTATAGTIVAVDDSATGIDGTTGATGVLNAYDSDTLNGVAAGPTNTTLALAPGETVPAGLSFDTATGNVDVAAGTPGGTYSWDYQICEIGFPTNCEIATITVTVIFTADVSLTKTNTPGVNGEVDQASDTVTSGETTTYVITVTNNGPDSVSGAVVTDTPAAGITCPGANPVTISGNGVPSGSFTVADLTGAGITLGTLGNGQAATLSFDCQVN